MDVNILNTVTPLKIFVFSHLDNTILDSLSSRYVCRVRIVYNKCMKKVSLKIIKY